MNKTIPMKKNDKKVIYLFVKYSLFSNLKINFIFEDGTQIKYISFNF